MLETGAFLADRYEIMEKIGTGGMSDVYRAIDEVLQREVAVKVLKAEFADDENFVSKFRSEASNAAKLEHPNIVNIYDVGSEDGLYYIIMEYVEGITLKTYIEKKGHLNYKEVISIAIQVGRGIEAAHNNKIIHRDIKPQNIIISKEGKVKVTDFGIARAASGNTVSADVMGSVHYISPEQARNGYVTAQSDIYSLGIVMYEMATGCVPFDGDTAVAVALKHLQGEMTSPSKLVRDIPVSLERIILKSTMKSPERRYSDMGELLIDLKKALVSPNEDFVVIPDTNESDKTRIITQKDLDTIRENSEPDITGIMTKGSDDDDDDDDDKINPKMEKAVQVMSIAAAVIIALVVIFLAGNVFGWFKFGSKRVREITQLEDVEEGDIEVPKLLGMTESEAEKALSKLGLKIKVKDGTIASSKYDKGQIASQSIKAGRKVVEGTVVPVTLSSGKSGIEDTITVPDVVGKTEAEAKQLLSAEGLSCSVEYTFSADTEQGHVISQTPAANSDAASGTSVTITVSQGEDMMPIPDVKGLSQNEASVKVSEAGFIPIFVKEYSDGVKDGYAIGTDPESYAVKDSRVTIRISDSSMEGKIVVPRLKDLNVHEAEAKLKEKGLSVRFLSSDGTYDDASYVLSQSPAEGSAVSKGDTIDITVTVSGGDSAN